MPRCLCHITLDLTKIDLKLRMLEGGEETQSQEPPDKDKSDAERTVDRGLLGEGVLGGPLESEGLTSNEEGSFTPQGPAGNPEPINTLEAVLDAEEVALTVKKIDGKEARETAGSKEQVPGTVEKKKKVTDNELMLKLRERMKLAEKQEEERKKRKSQAQRRKESDRKKEDKKQAAGSMKVRSMLKLWSREEGGEKPSTSGSIPHKLDIVRKPPGTDQGSSLTGRRSPGTSQRSSRSGRNQEATGS